MPSYTEVEPAMIGAMLAGGVFTLETVAVPRVGIIPTGDEIVPPSDSPKEGEVMAKVLARQTAKTVELVSLNPEHPNRSFDLAEVDWMARIIWASQ